MLQCSFWSAGLHPTLVTELLLLQVPTMTDVGECHIEASIQIYIWSSQGSSYVNAGHMFCILLMYLQFNTGMQSLIFPIGWIEVAISPIEVPIKPGIRPCIS